MIQRMFVTLDTKKTNYKNVGKINHGDDLILELTVLSDGNMISFNDPMVDLLVKKSDGKMIRQNSGIEHIKPNKFIIEVKKDCVTSPGLTTNQLIINDNGRISTCMFYYTILNSLEEDIIESISNVEVLEQLDEFTIQMKDKMENFDEELQNRMSELEDAIDDLVEFFGDSSVDLLEAELSRNEAEQSRAQAESVRVQNENRRLQNDLDLANAEAERVRAENVRIQNEVDRALIDAVMDQKESKREDSELERIQNESERMIDESTRQQNENTRQSNESIRMSNETDRKTQENRRVTAETNRVNAETTRRNNENSRISNEIERQKVMNEMKSLLEDAREFDERVGVIEDEIEEINSSLDNKINIIKDNLQQSLDDIKDNETLIIDSKFTGEQFILKDKHNITIIGSCDIIQNTIHEEVPSYDKPISDKPLFRVVNCENITIIGINFISQYECIDVKDSNNITFKQCEFDGNNNTSKFNGFVCRDSNVITLDGCYIHHLGEMPTYDNSNKRNNYSLGNGVSAYLVNGFNVLNCKIVNNAQNGIYTYACYNVTNDNNIIDNNGMSGIQFAFALGDEKNYCVINNKIINNYSDGLDINNTTSTSIDINCFINSNYYDGNGWYNKDRTKGTQDGSGVATLIGINNVYGKGNVVKDSYRHSLYISNCKDVNLEYKADKTTNGIGTGLYIGGCENITITPTIKHYCGDDNAISIDSTHGANYNILIKDGYVYSDTMQPICPKGSNEQDNIKVENMNLVTKTSTTSAYSELKFRGCNISSLENIGVNIGDGCILVNCKIISYSTTGVYLTNNSKLINCEVYSPLNYAVIIQGKNNVIMDNCSVYGKNGGVRIDNSTNVLIDKCDITGNGAGLHSVGSSKFKATNNRFSSLGGANSIRCETGSTVYLDNNRENGPSDYTTAKKYALQWV